MPGIFDDLPLPVNFCVILTASIAPKPEIARTLQRSDPQQRLKDYEAALLFWMRIPEPRIRGIVFADNTGYPLAELADRTRKLNRSTRTLEFLSFNEPAPPPGLSYGYSELLLINRVLELSHTATISSHFIKATGRYTFPFIKELIEDLPPTFDIAVDSRGQRPFGMRSNPISSIALTLASRHFFMRELSGLVKTMTPGPPWNRRQFVESVFYDYLYPRRHQPGIIMRWPTNCEPDGIGSNGDNYTSIGKLCGRAARTVNRIIWPSLWM